MHWFRVVQADRTSSNLLELHHCRESKVCRVLLHEFGVVPRTFSNHIITEIAGPVEFIRMSSGWFDPAEPSQSTFLQGKKGLQGSYALVQGGSRASNLIEPS